MQKYRANAMVAANLHTETPTTVDETGIAHFPAVDTHHALPLELVPQTISHMNTTDKQYRSIWPAACQPSPVRIFGLQHSSTLHPVNCIIPMHRI